MKFFGIRVGSKKKLSRQASLMPGQDSYTFRRSRTITGTTSKKVKPSAESSRSHLKTPRLKAHELRQQRSKIVRLLIAALMIVIGLVFLIANYVTEVPIFYSQVGSGAQPDSESYKKTVFEYFGKNPLQRFGFLLDRNELESYIKSIYSEVYSLETRTEWYGGKPELVIDFRKPILAWQSRDKRLYVDSEGIGFTFNFFNDALVEVDDRSGVSSDAGGSVASQRFLRFLGKTVGAINGSDRYKVEAIIIPTSTRQINLRLKGRGYDIKTHIDRDPLQQAEDVVNALKYFDSKRITPKYVDVRVAGKAFYK